MAVEDHPLYDEWTKKFDRAVHAEHRYYQAVMGAAGLPATNREAAKRDLLTARKEYAEISARLDVEIEAEMKSGRPIPD